MKNKHEIEKLGFEPVLKSRYLVILALLGVMAIMTSSFVSHYDLWAAYVLLGFVALIVFGLYSNVRFQKLHHKLRPFIVMRLLQVVTTLGYLALLYKTLGMAREALVPYIVYYLLGLATVYQFYSVFRLAARAKKESPDRCEFC